MNHSHWMRRDQGLKKKKGKKRHGRICATVQPICATVFVQLYGRFVQPYLCNSDQFCIHVIFYSSRSSYSLFRFDNLCKSIVNVLNSMVNLFINICATQWSNWCNSMVKFVQLNGQFVHSYLFNSIVIVLNSLCNLMVKFVQLNGQVCTTLWSICLFIFVQLL